MSFNNRGVKRSAFGNRIFGRSGGGGGNVGGGSGGSGMGSGLGNRGMSPWESGSMPGRGILPTPNNNLSMSNPQAELVIVSNLLSNLIRTQQDSQPQVPSLLSLGNNMNNPGPNFRGQPNFNAQRFNERPMRQSNLKNQRAQPYNKMGNRARDGVAGRRGPSAQQSRAQSQSGNQRTNGNQNQHRNDKNSKANASKQNQASKKEQQDLKKDNEKPKNENIVKSKESDVVEDKKRDWKDEKKEGEEQAMDVSGTDEKSGKESTKKDSDDKSPTKKGGDDAANGKKSEARHAESRYAAVPISLMFCHVCHKYMWDGFSFENHLRGRAHQLMMDKLDESYKLKVDLMRHELRVSEEQRELSLTNSKRRGKKVSVDLNVREYCTMCDLNFYGTLSSHRKSDKHQQLKTFLHPRCFPCVKEFPSRIEYDEHCLTPAHMVNAAQNEEQKKTKKNKLAKGESEVRTADDEEKDVGTDPKTTDKEEELPENTEYLLDIMDEIDMTKYKIPSFKYCRQNQLGIGSAMVKEIQGYHCEKCRRFMLTAEDMASHLKTLTHYRNFVAEVKTLTTPPTPAETTLDKSTEDTELKEVDEPQDIDDSEGNFKRRKIEKSTADDEEDDDDDDKNINEDVKECSPVVIQTQDVAEGEDNDKYDDPLDDEEMDSEEILENKGVMKNHDGPENNGQDLMTDTLETSDYFDIDTSINDSDETKTNDVTETEDPIIEETPKKEEVPKLVGILKKDETPKPEGILKKDETTKPEGILKKDETPKVAGILKKDETPKVAGILKKDETPKVVGILKKDETPKLEGILKKDETPKLEGILKKDETPKLEGILKKEETPKRPGILKKEETPRKEEILKKEETPKKDETTKKDDVAERKSGIPSPPPAPIISTPTNQMNKTPINHKQHTPNTPNTPMHHSNKSPRGGGGGRGGFRGGRGNQRARRSRR